MPNPEALASRRFWLSAAAMIAVFATMASSTIINVAIPRIIDQFGATPFQVQFVLTGFLAAMTVSMPTIGWLTGRWGIRNVLVVALLLFIVFSILAAAAPTLTVLIAARFAQGAVVGIVQPVALFALYLAFPPERRGTAVSLHAVAVALAPTIGPWFGGLVVEAFGWRYIFLLAVPIALFATVAVGVLIPSGHDGERQDHQFDLAGCLWLASALGLLFYGASEAAMGGAMPAISLVALAGGGLCSVLFVRRELTTEHPMVDLRLMASPAFSASCAIGFLIGAGLYGSTFLVPLFAQTVQGFSPADSGLILLPAGLVLLAVSLLAGGLANRIALAPLLATGILIFALSNLLFAMMDSTTGLIALAACLALGRVGVGLTIPTANLAALQSQSDVDAAQAAGISSFMRHFGAVAGIFGLSLLVGSKTADRSAHSISAAMAEGMQMAFLAAAALLFAGLGAVWLYWRSVDGGPPDPSGHHRHCHHPEEL